MIYLSYRIYIYIYIWRITLFKIINLTHALYLFHIFSTEHQTTVNWALPLKKVAPVGWDSRIQ